jgi:hypothetical protein
MENSAFQLFASLKENWSSLTARPVFYLNAGAHPTKTAAPAKIPLPDGGPERHPNG